MARSERLRHPDDAPRTGRADRQITLAEADLVRVLHLLDDLADVLTLAASVEDRSGGPSTLYAAGLAERLRELRASLRRPRDDGPEMGSGAGEWRSALCVALDDVPLRTATMRAQTRYDDTSDHGAGTRA